MTNSALCPLTSALLSGNLELIRACGCRDPSTSRAATRCAQDDELCPLSSHFCLLAAQFLISIFHFPSRPFPTKPRFPSAAIRSPIVLPISIFYFPTTIMRGLFARTEWSRPFPTSYPISIFQPPFARAATWGRPYGRVFISRICPLSSHFCPLVGESWVD